MESQRDATGTRIFHEDRRAVWRVTWTLALAFTGVAWLMQRGGAFPWVLFAGVALLLAGIGMSALLARSKPVVGVGPDGLRVFAGDRGRASGIHGEAGGFTIPWEAVTGVAFEERVAHRHRDAEKHPMKVEPLCFRIAESLPSPDGQRGFLERVVGRESSPDRLRSPSARCASADSVGHLAAVGEFFLWNPDERTLDLATAPRGGFPALTAAVERAAPRLGDASAGRRQGLGAPVAYAVYDAGVALALLAIVLLWATGRADVVGDLADRVLTWGGSVGP